MSCQFIWCVLAKGVPIFDKTKYKGMEKVCITPVDESIKVRVDSLNLLNEFKMLGFDTLSGFVGVVQENYDEFKNYNNTKPLLAFWAGRKHCEEFNAKMQSLINQLKNE